MSAPWSASEALHGWRWWWCSCLMSFSSSLAGGTTISAVCRRRFNHKLPAKITEGDAAVRRLLTASACEGGSRVTHLTATSVRPGSCTREGTWPRYGFCCSCAQSIAAAAKNRQSCHNSPGLQPQPPSRQTRLVARLHRRRRKAHLKHLQKSGSDFPRGKEPGELLEVRLALEEQVHERHAAIVT